MSTGTSAYTKSLSWSSDHACQKSYEKRVSQLSPVSDVYLLYYWSLRLSMLLHHWQCLLECKRWFSLVTCIFCIFILLVSLLIFLQSCQLCRSGTREEYDEKDRLLTSVTTLWEDDNTHKKEEQTKKNSRRKWKACSRCRDPWRCNADVIRKKNMVGYRCRSPKHSKCMLYFTECKTVMKIEMSTS